MIERRRTDRVDVEKLRDVAMRRHRELHYPDPEVRTQVLTASALDHKCAAYGCPSRIAADRLFCAADWDLVPGALRKLLSDAYEPHADLRWPIHLVEQAIRSTIRTDDMQAILNRVELSLQEDLFQAAQCDAEYCVSHLHCDGCLSCDVTTKPRIVTERWTNDRLDVLYCDACALIVADGKNQFFCFVAERVAA